MKNLLLSESLFNKKVLKRLEHKCFLMNFAIFFRKDFFDDKSFFFYFFDDIYKHQDSFRKIYSTLHCVKKSAFNKDNILFGYFNGFIKGIWLS